MWGGGDFDNVKVKGGAGEMEGNHSRVARSRNRNADGLNFVDAHTQRALNEFDSLRVKRERNWEAVTQQPDQGGLAQSTDGDSEGKIRLTMGVRLGNRENTRKCLEYIPFRRMQLKERFKRGIRLSK